MLWYAAGDANAPGLYFSESKNKDESFAPRQLLAQGGVRGTPVLAAGNNSDVAVWEMTGANGAEAKVRTVGGSEAAVSIGANVELAAAAFSKDGLFVAYVSKVNEKRSVWLIKAAH